MKEFLKKNINKRRVLVVDDEPINCELLDAILSQNYDVTCVSNGVEAMEELRSASTPYSLILLDILMPRKSGIQTLAECKEDENLKNIPVIMMTSEKSAESRSIRMGAADFISKPYRMPEVIIARCERVIEYSEEKAMIRSIEKDPLTGLYVELFFLAYVRRLLEHSSKDIDAVAITINEGNASDHVLTQTARLIRKIQIKSRGMSCRTSDNTILICCLHREDHEQLLAEIKNELAKDPGAADIRFGQGIVSHINATKPAEEWFERAKEAALK